MEKIILDGKRLSDKDMAHVYLKEMLSLPEYYGNNMDALYDCLTELSDVDIELKIPEEPEGYVKQIIRVLKAAAAENENIKVNFIKEIG